MPRRFPVLLAASLLSTICFAQAPDDLLRRRLPPPGRGEALRSRIVALPDQLPLSVPDGFRVSLFAAGLSLPREMVQLPSGHLLVVESSGGRVRELVDRDADGRVDAKTVWVGGLKRPFGIALQPAGTSADQGSHVYVGNTDSIVRFALLPDGSAGPWETVVEQISLEGKPIWEGGHWTRDVLFSRDGSSLFVSVGSRSNNNAGEPTGRAAILRHAADGTGPKLYATGLRNPVGITLRPGTDEIWAAVNERDNLGNDLVPDYVTHVAEGGFYGWPYWYIGTNPDPKHARKLPNPAPEVLVPDVLLQSHSAPLGLAFYEGSQFPERYRGGLFVGLHGSWNRVPLTGYKLAFIPFRDGKPSGGPEDFLTGFLKDAEKGEVYGRPVAPLVLRDGSLLVTDDEAGRIWRITWEGGPD